MTSEPYGTWPSPITSEFVSKQGAETSEVLVDSKKSTIYHIESRPSNKGHYVVVNDTEHHDITDPDEWNVQTGVHGYGGAPAVVFDGNVYFSNGSDGRVYRVQDSPGDIPKLIVPTSDKNPYRFAAFVVHPNLPHLVVAIRQDHTMDKPADVVNTLCVINTKENKRTVKSIIEGVIKNADFYGPPTISPNGKRIAWQQWNHPDMPWEAGEIYIADIIESPDDISLTNPVSIASKLHTSYAFPKWINDDTLLFTSDESGFINPWIYRKGKATPVFSEPVTKDFGTPMWLLSFFPYAPLDEAGKYAVFIGSEHGRDDLYLVDLENGSPPRALNTPYVVVTGLQSFSKENLEVVFSGTKEDEEASIVKCTFTRDLVASFSIVKPAPIPPFSTKIISRPREFDVPGYYGDVHVTYYEPHNPDHTASPQEKPPCILNVHGGPTALQGRGLDWTHQYYTSRGWAWLDVNYGGSSGYGREYIERLEKLWGIVDTDDCISAAQAISSSPGPLDKPVDPRRICIRGRSAGGFNVFASLSYGRLRTVFVAGTSYAGLSDMKSFAEKTHKFELHYNEKLLGGIYEKVPSIYKLRSPATHAGAIGVPLLILQGTKDEVVPPDQAQLMYDRIIEAGGRAKLQWFEGEGHHFTQETNLKDALESEIIWYNTILGIKE